MNLQKCDIIELKSLKEPTDYLALASNPETVEKVECCMRVWIKQMEQVTSSILWSFRSHITGVTDGRILSWYSHCPHLIPHTLIKKRASVCFLLTIIIKEE